MSPFGKRFVLSLFACFCLTASCATTKMTDVRRDENYRGTIRKVVVIGIFKEPDTRKIFEYDFADRLKARGIGAMNAGPFSARLLLDEYPLDRDHIGPADGRTVHLVIIGFGKMGQSIALQAARNCFQNPVFQVAEKRNIA